MWPPDEGGQKPTDMRAAVQTNGHGLRLKVGNEALDPLNRRVAIIELVQPGDGGLLVKVRMRGPYAGTVTYPASTLRPIE